MPNKILHLNIKRKWFDMIKSGEKKEEYRDIKPFYERKFINIKEKEKRHIWKNGFWILQGHMAFRPHDIIICFSNGYAKNRDQIFIECTGLKKGIGKKEWGASLNDQFILSLGNILEAKLCQK